MNKNNLKFILDFSDDLYFSMTPKITPNLKFFSVKWDLNSSKKTQNVLNVTKYAENY